MCEKKTLSEQTCTPRSPELLIMSSPPCPKVERRRCNQHELFRLGALYPFVDLRGASEPSPAPQVHMCTNLGLPRALLGGWPLAPPHPHHAPPLRGRPDPQAPAWPLGAPQAFLQLEMTCSSPAYLLPGTVPLPPGIPEGPDCVARCGRVKGAHRPPVAYPCTLKGSRARPQVGKGEPSPL